ncbi:cupin, partial [Streptomyces sp. G35A]
MVSGPPFGAPLPGAAGPSHPSAWNREAADGVCGGVPHPPA